MANKDHWQGVSPGGINCKKCRKEIKKGKKIIYPGKKFSLRGILSSGYCSKKCGGF